MTSRSLFLCLPLALTAQTSEDAAAIMTKMAANFERSLEARRQFVYEQKVRSSLVRTNGEVSRVERRQYLVTPGPTDTEKKLTSFQGLYRRGGTMHPYDKPGFQYKGTDLDGGLLSGLTDDLVNAKNTRDGIPRNLFPLRAGELQHYRFSWKGEATVNGRRAYEIAFEPVRKGACSLVDDEEECGTRAWSGVALVDVEELQPVRVYTEQAASVPWGIRFFLGTNMRQSGFSLAFVRVAENVWFPNVYGTEFRFNALWGYKRTVTLSLESSGFHKTDVNSSVQYDTAGVTP